VVHVRLKRSAVVAAFVAAVALAVVPAAGASSHIYWWQSNMPANGQGYDLTYHNHTYNELYFGPNAGWRSELWERTPAGYRHFDKWCSGNCYFAHPGYYYTGSYCSNRDTYGQTHFVYDCMNEW
jgi:hypothetical protein